MLAGQLNLLDWAEARRLRDEGMTRAAEHSPNFQELAYAAIMRVAQRQPHVHVDDIRAEGIPEPHHPNAWGWPWQRAIRDGIIQRSNQVRQSKDPTKHAHNYPVYFSRVYIPGGFHE